MILYHPFVTLKRFDNGKSGVKSCNILPHFNFKVGEI